MLDLCLLVLSDSSRTIPGRCFELVHAELFAVFTDRSLLPLFCFLDDLGTSEANLRYEIRSG